MCLLQLCAAARSSFGMGRIHGHCRLALLSVLAIAVLGCALADAASVASRAAAEFPRPINPYIEGPAPLEAESCTRRNGCLGKSKYDCTSSIWFEALLLPDRVIMLRW